MTEYYSSEELFKNTKSLNENIDYCFDLFEKAKSDIKINTNIILSGIPKEVTQKDDIIKWVRKISLGAEIVVYEISQSKNNKTSSNHLSIIRFNKEERPLYENIDRIIKLKAFL